MQLPTPTTMEMELQQLRKDLAGRVWPWQVFTVQEIRPVLGSPQQSPYDTVNLILTNATGKEVFVWTPVWESAEVHALRPFGSALHLPDGSAGWKSDVWGAGNQCISLPAEHTFLCWIVLLAPTGENLLARLKNEDTGTAIFPVKIEGKLYEVPIKL